MRRSLETAAAELKKTRNRGGLAADYSGLKPSDSYPLQPGGSCATRPRRSERISSERFLHSLRTAGRSFHIILCW